MYINELIKEQQCKSYAYYSKLKLNSGNEASRIKREIFTLFVSNIETLTDEELSNLLFCLPNNIILAADKKEKAYLSTLYMRMRYYFKQNISEIIDKDIFYEFNIEGQPYTGKVDIVCKNTAGELLCINFSRKATTFSKKARKEENKIQNNLELISMKLGLESKYPGITPQIWHLLAKSDTSNKYSEVFEQKEGENIITYDISETSELKNKFLMAKALTYQKNCDSCYYKVLCSSFIKPTTKSKDSTITATNIAATKSTVAFTPKQRDAINHIDGPSRIIAGPGAGKTATIIGKMEHLLKQGINADKILFLTFTRKACSEIIERAEKISHKIPKISTFNSLAFEIIKGNKELLNIKDIKLASKIDRYEFIIKALIEANLPNLSYAGLYEKYGIVPKLDKVFLYLISNYGYTITISNAINEQITDKFELSEDLMANLPILYPIYTQLILAAGFIDYSDQLKLCNELFLEHPNIAKMYAAKWSYIIVDESQDMDAEQNNFVTTLALPNSNITIVGDDDQAIYGFRNGSNNYMLKFHKTFFDCRDIILDDNFRSTSPILALSNNFIRNNQNRYVKTITSLKLGTNPEIINGDYSKIVEDIEHLSHKYSLGDIAVLARNNKELDKLALFLKELNIGFSASKEYLIDSYVFNTVRIFSQLFINITNDINIYWLLKNFYDLNDEDLSTKSYDISLMDHSSKYSNLLRNDLGRIKTFSCVQEQVGYIANKLLGLVRDPALDIIYDLISTREIATIEELADILNKMYLYQDDTRIFTDTSDDKINLLTAHDSKGKEFPVVIIIDSEKFEGEGTQEEIEEARRVLYVALTRAKEKEYIYYNKETSIVKELLEANNTACLKEAI